MSALYRYPIQIDIKHITEENNANIVTKFAVIPLDLRYLARYFKFL